MGLSQFNLVIKNYQNSIWDVKKKKNITTQLINVSEIKQF